MGAGDRKSWTNLSEQYCVTRFSDELLKRCRKVVDVVEGDPGKMEQVKKAVFDLVVIGGLMSRIVLQSI